MTGAALPRRRSATACWRSRPLVASDDAELRTCRFRLKDREREIGRASGAPVETTHAAVWTLADGEVIRMELFDDRQQALEAVGLRE